MTMCAIHDAGSIELYFYGELPDDDRSEVERHLERCRVCAAAREELRVIRSALATRPAIERPASGDWTAFMTRLDEAVRVQASTPVVVPFVPRRVAARPSVAGLLATAALLAVVSLSVFMASQAGRQLLEPSLSTAARAGVTNVSHAAGAEDGAPMQAGLLSVGTRHLERSKLVVLGLAAKEPSGVELADWEYERELAASLLNDTRLYRMAAEQRGLSSLAGIMRDLELVLLQASMTESTDDSALPQIQRLIARRGLVEKMDVVGTTGLVP
jgi:hypothetical protein